MNYADIAGLAEKELVKRMKSLRADIFEARMKNALGQLTNPMTIREMRRNIARLQTALKAKMAGATEKPAKAKSAAKKATGTKKAGTRGKKTAAKG